MKKTFPAVDIAKFLGACLIPALHIPYPDAPYVEMVRQYIARLGVPFFFACAGFFFYGGIRRDGSLNTLFKQAKRILFLLLIYFALYAPMSFIGIYSDAPNMQSALIRFVQGAIFNTPGYLWYLGSLLIGMCLLYWFRERLLFFSALASLLYVIGVIGNSYREILHIVPGWYYSIFLTTRNGVFFAPIFCCLGALVSEALARGGEKTGPFPSILLLSAGTVLFILEVSFVRGRVDPKEDTSMYFALPLVIAGLLPLLVRKEREQNEGYLFFRQSSVVIYCVQWGFLRLFGGALTLVGSSIYKANIPTLFAAHLGLIAFGCAATYALRKSKTPLAKRLI